MNDQAAVPAGLSGIATRSATRLRRSIPGWAIWISAALLLGVYQGLNAWIGVQGTTRAAWEPFVWELSSIWMLIWLLPVVARLEGQVNIDSQPGAAAVLGPR